jgi:hypothetical protein
MKLVRANSRPNEHSDSKRYRRNDASLKAIEDLITGLLQLRADSAQAGLDRVTACIDYAYNEALCSLRSDNPSASTIKKPPLIER